MPNTTATATATAIQAALTSIYSLRELILKENQMDWEGDQLMDIAMKAVNEFRKLEIQRQRAAGKSLEECASTFFMTRERVRQVER